MVESLRSIRRYSAIKWLRAMPDLVELRDKLVTPLLERAMKAKRNPDYTQKERDRLQGVVDGLRQVSIYLEDVND